MKAFIFSLIVILLAMFPYIYYIDNSTEWTHVMEMDTLEYLESTPTWFSTEVIHKYRVNTASGSYLVWSFKKHRLVQAIRVTDYIFYKRTRLYFVSIPDEVTDLLGYLNMLQKTDSGKILEQVGVPIEATKFNYM